MPNIELFYNIELNKINSELKTAFGSPSGEKICIADAKIIVRERNPFLDKKKNYEKHCQKDVERDIQYQKEEFLTESQESTTFSISSKYTCKNAQERGCGCRLVVEN